MGDARTAWLAITGNPLRFLRSQWPWRALWYLLTSLPFFVVVVGLVSEDQQPALVVVIAILVAAAVVLSGPIAVVERWRLKLLDPAEARTLKPQARTSITSPTGWRQIGFALLWMTILPLINGFVVITAGLTIRNLVLELTDPPLVRVPTVAVVLIGLVCCAYLFTVVAIAEAALARGLLGVPREQRMIELTRSRARLVDSFEAERQRIERDLHDGTQHQLTVVLMQLGLAQLDVREDPERTAQAISLAHDHTLAALNELRRVIRGVHPSVLTDRGLVAAVTDLARHCPVPVSLDLDVPHRSAPAVEAAAYFCVSECLTNAIKHGNALQVTIRVKVSQQLFLEVSDNGTGGADPSAGTGITGLADRVAVLEGTLSLSSPPGGPTRIQVELPCE